MSIGVLERRTSEVVEIQCEFVRLNGADRIIGERDVWWCGEQLHRLPTPVEDELQPGISHARTRPTIVARNSRGGVVGCSREPRVSSTAARRPCGPACRRSEAPHI